MNTIRNIILQLLIAGCALSIVMACTDGGTPETAEALNVVADTRAEGDDEVEITADADINVKIGETTKVYTLKTDGSLAPKDAAGRIYIAPGTATLPVYAWGTVYISYTAVAMSYANPTAAVTWTADANPTVAIALAPAMARVKVSVTTDLTLADQDAIKLYNVKRPVMTDGYYEWNTAMPPALKPNSNTSPIIMSGGGYTPIIPGTVDTGQHLLTITDNGGKEYYIIARRPHIFLAGKEYELKVAINTKGEPVLTDIVIADYTAGGEINTGNTNMETFRFMAWAERVRGGATDEDFTLTDNIDLSGAGNWVRIGADGNTAYKGKFDGGGYTISGLTLNAAGAGNQGLFGYTGSGAVIANVTLKNPAVTATGSYTGALVGFAAGGTISHCRVVGGTVAGDFGTGGLIGYSGDIHIVGCSVDATVTGSANVGGLAGEASTSHIIACTAAGSVTATSDTAGGLVGKYDGNNVFTMSFCYSTADVSATVWTAGGLVGKNTNGIITSCRATGGVTSSVTPNSTGSLIGENNGTDVSYCNATGTAASGKLMGAGSNAGSFITADTDAAMIYAILTNDPGVSPVTAKMCAPGTTTVSTYTFTKAVWNTDLTLDITQAIP